MAGSQYPVGHGWITVSVGHGWITVSSKPWLDHIGHGWDWLQIYRILDGGLSSPAPFTSFDSSSYSPPLVRYLLFYAHSPPDLDGRT
ncbi:hypothetical protein RRG08_039108 [Elysia crispata]|uniref:Uncharacterized protein n=1 Tax=Elysia crispata TaxID=231223 RepID=A0AAE1DJ14_9GAST|nr:hypothetical protein RRG08_039108 [Elysia crispata]